MTTALTQEQAHRRRQRAAQLSLASNSLLTVLKLGVGIGTGSVAVLAEGVNSAMDLVATVITFVAVRRSGRPPDSLHPWGYGKLESLAGMVEAAAIAAAGVFVVADAVRELRSHVMQEASWISVAVMLVSLVCNLLLSKRVLTIASQTQSVALEAEGQHIWTDVLTSGGVLAALLLTRFLHSPSIQPVAAILVGGLIFRTAYQVARMALAPLLDAALPDADRLQIQRLLQNDPRVLGWHNLRTRRSGSSRMVDMHLMLQDDLSFVEAHERAEALEEAISGLFNGHTDVIIHAEPFHAEQRHQMEHHPDQHAAPEGK